MRPSWTPLSIKAFLIAAPVQVVAAAVIQPSGGNGYEQHAMKAPPWSADSPGTLRIDVALTHVNHAPGWARAPACPGAPAPPLNTNRVKTLTVGPLSVGQESTAATFDLEGNLHNE